MDLGSPKLRGPVEVQGLEQKSQDLLVAAEASDHQVLGARNLLQSLFKERSGARICSRSWNIIQNQSKVNENI